MDAHLVVHELVKDTYLLSGDQILKRLYYIHEGLLRHFYYNENGRETTGWFAAETEILYFANSYRQRIPIPGNIQLLEKSTLVSLTYDELDSLYQVDPTANALGRRISENQLQYFLKREGLFRSRVSKERYLRYLDFFPNLFGRTQNQHVATYLELSAGTISRALSGSSKKKQDTKPKKKTLAPGNKRK